jgi:hypothetical protein
VCRPVPSGAVHGCRPQVRGARASSVGEPAVVVGGQ